MSSSPTRSTFSWSAWPQGLASITPSAHLLIPVKCGCLSASHSASNPARKPSLPITKASRLAWLDPLGLPTFFSSSGPLPSSCSSCHRPTMPLPASIGLAFWISYKSQLSLSPLISTSSFPRLVGSSTTPSCAKFSCSTPCVMRSLPSDL